MIFLVYVVVDSEKPNGVYGVFSTKKDAERYCERLKPNSKVIFERKVDDLIKEKGGDAIRN